MKSNQQTSGRFSVFFGGVGGGMGSWLGGSVWCLGAKKATKPFGARTSSRPLARFPSRSLSLLPRRHPCSPGRFLSSVVSSKRIHWSRVFVQGKQSAARLGGQKTEAHMKLNATTGLSSSVKRITKPSNVRNKNGQITSKH